MIMAKSDPPDGRAGGKREWEQVAPLLDDALMSLGEKDRAAVVLRYIQGKSRGEVSKALGIAENTATRRVGRGVEKLRRFFAKKGVMLPTLLLATIINENAVQAAPAGLAGTCSALAAGGTAVPANISFIAKGAMKMMMWAKIKLTAMVCAAAMVAGGTGFVGVKLASAAADEKGFIKLEQGKSGLVVASQSTGAAVELVLVDKAGKNPRPIAKESVALNPDRSFIEVKPAGEALELRAKGRFALIPGYHHSDALFDPTVCKGKEILVPADNFLMFLPEGGKSVFVFIWAKNSKQVPTLVVEGQGKTARFSAMRLTFEGKPIFVGMLDNAGYVDGLADRKLDFAFSVEERPNLKYARVQTGYKTNFSAFWWASLFKPPAKDDVAGPIGTKWALGPSPKTTFHDLIGRYQYPCGIMNDEWVLELEQRYAPFHAAVMYPAARTSPANTFNPPFTPNDKYTLSDLFLEALGDKEFREMIDYAGMSDTWVQVPDGEPSTEATCAGWWPMFGGFKEKNKDKFDKGIRGLYNFCFYNRKRVDHYRDAAKSVIALCKEKQKDKDMKTLAERVIHAAEEIEKLWEEKDKAFQKFVQERVASKNTFDGNWHLIFTVKEAEKAGFNPETFAKVRDFHTKVFEDWMKGDATAEKRVSRADWTSIGGPLDGVLEKGRELIEEVGQVAAVSGVENEKSRLLAIEIREMLAKAMRLSHCKEGKRNTNTKLVSPRGRSVAASK